MFEEFVDKYVKRKNVNRGFVDTFILVLTSVWVIYTVLILVRFPVKQYWFFVISLIYLVCLLVVARLVGKGRNSSSSRDQNMQNVRGILNEMKIRGNDGMEFLIRECDRELQKPANSENVKKWLYRIAVGVGVLVAYLICVKFDVLSEIEDSIKEFLELSIGGMIFSVLNVLNSVISSKLFGDPQNRAIVIFLGIVVVGFALMGIAISMILSDLMIFIDKKRNAIKEIREALVFQRFTTRE